MQVKVNTKDLKEILKLHSVVVKDSPEGILKGIELTANSKLRLRTTDLENEVITDIVTKINTAGKCVIPFKILSDVVNTCDEPFINIESQAENKCKVDKMLINGYPVDEYPPTINLNPDKCKLVDNLDFKEFMKSLTLLKDFRAIDTDRPLLTGFHLDTECNYIFATDSYRMGIKPFAFNSNIENFNSNIGNITIRGKLYNILKLMDADKFSILIEGKEIVFKVGNSFIKSRIYEGNYPDCLKYIPDKSIVKYEIDTEKVIKIIDKASKLIKDKTHAVIPVILNFHNNILTITKESKDIGKFEDSVNIKGKDELRITFNGEYLKSCLANYKTAVISIENNLKPVLITGDNDLITILMPVKIA